VEADLRGQAMKSEQMAEWRHESSEWRIQRRYGPPEIPLRILIREEGRSDCSENEAELIKKFNIGRVKHQLAVASAFSKLTLQSLPYLLGDQDLSNSTIALESVSLQLGTHLCLYNIFIIYIHNTTHHTTHSYIDRIEDR